MTVLHLKKTSGLHNVHTVYIEGLRKATIDDNPKVENLVTLSIDTKLSQAYWCFIVIIMKIKLLLPCCSTIVKKGSIANGASGPYFFCYHSSRLPHKIHTKKRENIRKIRVNVITNKPRAVVESIGTPVLLSFLTLLILLLHYTTLYSRAYITLLEKILEKFIFKWIFNDEGGGVDMKVIYHWKYNEILPSLQWILIKI